MPEISSRRLLAIAGLVTGLLPCVWSSPARATPAYAVRSAYACDTCHVEPVGWAEGDLRDRRCTLNCGACHVNPTGGGMRNPAGVFYSRQVLPSFGQRPAPETGPGRARFDIFRGFSGWEPSTVAASEVAERYGSIDPDPTFDYGFDLRSAVFVPLEASDRDTAAFPMQADLYLMSRPLDRLVLYGTVGLMGSKQRTYDDLEERTGFQQLVAARELYVMADRLPYNAYVRAGRFAPPFGWRLADHTSFVRRELGFDQNRQVFGIEGGLNPNYPYANLAVFYQGADAWPGDVEKEGVGFAATAGYRDLAAHVGASVQGLDRFDGPEELIGGLNWGINLYPLTYLGEVDLRRRFADGGRSGHNARFAYQELNLHVLRGVSVLAKYDWMDLNTGVGGEHQHRGTAGVQWNPYTYGQLDLQYRKTWISGETDQQDLLLMLHVFL